MHKINVERLLNLSNNYKFYMYTVFLFEAMELPSLSFLVRTGNEFITIYHVLSDSGV